jgi:hypothetical protein
MKQRSVNFREEQKIIEQLQRIADAEGSSLSAIYRRLGRLFLASLPHNGNHREKKEQAST